MFRNVQRALAASVCTILVLCAPSIQPTYAQQAAADTLVEAERAARRAANEAWLRTIPDYEMRLYARLNDIKERQIRQDRIIGFGFLITILLMVGGGVMLWRRQRTAVLVAGSKVSGLNDDALRALSAGYTTSDVSVLREIIRLWSDARTASLKRRQKRIERLLSEVEHSVTADFEIRESLEELRRAVASLGDEVNATAGNAPPQTG